MRHFLKFDLLCKETNYIFAVQFGIGIKKSGSDCSDLNIKKHCGVEQLVARRAHNPKVIGSSPIPATKWKKRQNAVLILVCLFSFLL